MADFIAELMPNEKDEMLLESSFVAIESLAVTRPTLNCKLYVDGSLSNQGCRFDLILTSLELKRLRIECVL